MINYDLTFLTTHQDEFEIFNLINSIDSNNNSTSVLLIVVSQECTLSYQTTNSNLSIVFLDEKKMGLSMARNRGLNYLEQKSISSKYIMFPDDDSSFDKVFFENFPKKLNSNKCFITPIYNVGTKQSYLSKISKNKALVNENDHGLIGSPNQIVLYNKFKNEIWFNEDLGIGGKYGSCEDYDFFIRLNRKGAQFFYNDEIYSFHPKKKIDGKINFSKILKRYKSYSPGFIYIIKKYHKYSLIPIFIIRPLGASFLCFLKLNFKRGFIYLCIFFYRIKLLVIGL